MHFVTNLFPIMAVQNLSKSDKICQLLTKLCCHIFYAPSDYRRSENRDQSPVQLTDL